MKDLSAESTITVEQLKTQLKSAGTTYLLAERSGEEHADEYAQFLFLGEHEGVEVVYDCMLYTLRLHHESELFEIAEHRAAQHFPNYKQIDYEEDENGNLKALDDLEEEIGLFIAEVIIELEEEDSVKVKEHVDYDFGVKDEIGLDVGLHVEKITPRVIEKFISDFNSGKLQLDTNLYSFQTRPSGG
jgi:hypothetical protein